MSAHATRSQRQVMPAGRMNMTPEEAIQFKNQLDEFQKARQSKLAYKFRKFLLLFNPSFWILHPICLIS